MKTKMAKWIKTATNRNNSKNRRKLTKTKNPYKKKSINKIISPINQSLKT